MHRIANTDGGAVHVEQLKLGGLCDGLLHHAASRLHALTNASVARVEVVEGDVGARQGDRCVRRSVVEGKAQLHERCESAAARLRSEEVDNAKRAIRPCLESIVGRSKGGILGVVAHLEVDECAIG